MSTTSSHKRAGFSGDTAHCLVLHLHTLLFLSQQDMPHPSMPAEHTRQVSGETNKQIKNFHNTDLLLQLAQFNQPEHQLN